VLGQDGDHGAEEGYNNKPEKRHYKLVVRLDPKNDNLFLREHSFSALLNHELGTHLFRNINEGLQPWYSDRKKFRLSSGCDFEMLTIEEGLAAIHTTIELPLNELWFHSLLYLAPVVYEKSGGNFDKALKSLSKVCGHRELNVRLLKRAERGSGRHDQSYFIGAHKLLSDRKNIDFVDLMAGKLLPKELSRVRRITRRTGLKVPEFLLDYGSYMAKLDRIARANFLS